MTPAHLSRIAEILEDDAEMLHAGYTVDGVWPDDEMAVQAQKDHAELLELARIARGGA